MTPEVSVVVPTRNRPELLAQAVRSILAQDRVSLEVIVVDEGSTPTVESYAAGVLRDPRVQVVRHDEPRGLPAARNAGIAVARAPWIGFCDDDDLWAPDKLARQLDAAEADGARWSAAGLLVTDLALRPLDHHRMAAPELRLRQHNTIPAGGSSVIAHRDVFALAGAFDERLRSSEDWEMWIRALDAVGPPAPVDAPLVVYRVSSTSMSMNIQQMRESRAMVLDMHGVAATAADDRAYEEFIVRQIVRSGGRGRAAAEYFRMGARYRDATVLAKALVALAAPKVLDAIGVRRAVGRIPTAWIDEVRGWSHAYGAVAVETRSAVPS